MASFRSFFENWAGDSLFDEQKVVMERLLSVKGEILEIGCGKGLFLLKLLEKGYVADGIDPSPFLIGQAHLLMQQAGFSPLLEVQPFGDFRLSKKYEAVCLLRGMIHSLGSFEDICHFFASLSDQMEIDKDLFLSFFLPEWNLPIETDWHKLYGVENREEKERYTLLEKMVFDPFAQEVQFFHELEHESASLMKKERWNLSIHLYSRREVELLLEKYHFTVVRADFYQSKQEGRARGIVFIQAKKNKPIA